MRTSHTRLSLHHGHPNSGVSCQRNGSASFSLPNCLAVVLVVEQPAPNLSTKQKAPSSSGLPFFRRSTTNCLDITASNQAT